MSRRPTASTEVWALTAAVAAGAGVVIWSQVGVAPRGLPAIVPWWAFIGLFYLAETTVLHFRFRRHVHSFSMSEVPLIVGVVLLAPTELHLAHIVGSALAMAIARRQSLVKLAFNVSQIGLQVGTATLLFDAVVGAGDPLGPRGWLAAAIVAFATYAISTGLITAAVRLSGGQVDDAERAAMMSLSSLAVLMNVALGLAVTTILVARPENAWLAVVPPLILYFAYRAYISQRLERERLQGLYTVSKQLHRLPRMQDAFGASLDHAVQTFNVERAEIHFYPDGPSAPGTMSIIRCNDGPAELMLPAPPIAAGSMLSEIVAGQSSTIASDGRVKPSSRVASPAMFTGIPCNDGAFAAFVVKQPLDDVGRFDQSDLSLLETLAGHLGVSIENERLGASVAHLTELRDRLRYQASHDPLTGIANRPRLMESIEQVIEGGEASTSALLYVDLDEFKRVNDTSGHNVGDQMLIHVASVLLASCRGEDLVARIGGDEFAVLLCDLAGPDDAEVVARRIAVRLQEPIELIGVELTPTASVGLVMLDEAETTEELINAADRAMYEAKREGLGSYRVHSQVSHRLPFHDRSFGFEVARATRDSELCVEYQPIIDLHTDRVMSVEVLVRWDHPRRGRLEPTEFIPLSEQLGLIGQIDRWVLETAITELTAEFDGAGIDIPTISINASAVDLNDPGYADRLLKQLSRLEFPAARVQLEVTETGVVADGSTALTALRRAGVRVALDDFGTGYSSLAYLDDLPVDAIKIDRSFTSRLGRARVYSLVAMMIQIGETMSLDVVAEGIEIPEQRAVLERLGCSYGQGFGIARPVPVEGLVALIDSLSMRPTLEVVASTGRR